MTEVQPVDVDEPRPCEHENFRADVAVNRLLDSGMFAADVKIECTDCGEPFRFVGLPAGVSFERPMVAIDGLELRAPIEPASVKGLHALQATASFQMPATTARGRES